MINIKKIIMIACILVLVGGIGSVMSYRFYEPATLAVTKEVQSTEITSIEIDIQNEKVDIIPTTDPTPKVELTGTEDSHSKTELVVEENNNTLSIHTENEMGKWFSFNFFNSSRTLTVYLPEQEYQRLAVEISNGSLQAQGLTINEVNVETKNGKIDLSDIVADSYQLKTSNGKIDLENVEGELAARANNGAISLVTENLDRNINFETDNGRIKIQSEKEPTNAVIDTKVDNGRINLFGDSDYNTIIGDGDNLVKLSTKNGSITVTQ
ncbi:DUF4097 family beta strand repeat protein [Gracilibacillus salitolerans]|uniref:DUF4097 family beta strand repeat protein n=1 Tax=Gracilibacillus salitolerans TaxID=2663022 RepID=A0A5Q2TE54_9BACI|nr:DUF4097 family beta strand repeat-containing protein [Gracilibacillus salitolerans]QGH33024.1 DUF4097 family beta strand repeat protein [Gracilibacillus salitolerans]